MKLTTRRPSEVLDIRQPPAEEQPTVELLPDQEDKKLDIIDEGGTYVY